MKLLLLLLLAGCSPYVGYTHLSDPRIKGDGYDLFCGGVKTESEIEVTAGACKNLRGGEFVKIDVEYVFREGNQYDD